MTEPDNIVYLHGASDREITKTPSPLKWCEKRCRRIEVDDEYRIIKCTDCGRVVNPFDYLLYWSKEDDGNLRRIKEQQVEIHRQRNQLASLKVAIRKENAGLRRRLQRIPK